MDPAQESERGLRDAARAIQEGLDHHRAGRLPQAEQIYRGVLDSDPNHPDALHLLGVIAHQVEKDELAVDLISKAIRHAPSNPHYLSNLGEAYRGLRRLDEAIDCYDKALSIQPGYAEALSNRGIALRGLNRHDEALASFDRAVAIRPEYPEALNNRGCTLRDLGRFDEALSSFERAIAIRAGYAEALHNCGMALKQLKRYEEALARYDQALALNPGNAETRFNRGNAQRELKRYDRALADYDQALAIRPGYAEALNNRGMALKELKRYDEALASYDQALAIKPDLAEAHNSRGIVLQELGRHDEALASYDRALSSKTDADKPHYNRANTLRDLKRYDEALASYELALAINPGFAEAHWNRGLCLLMLGDFDRGWQGYEWRWQCGELPLARRNFAQPLWLGDADLAGKTILLYSEQGIGDAVQFVRYVGEVSRKGAKVVLEVQAVLKPLLSRIAGAQHVLARGEPLPAFDFHCPLQSLPLAFRTRLETIPAANPYISVSKTAVAAWRRKIARKGMRLVGLSWKGDPRYSRDRDRSVPLAALKPLLGCAGVRFVSLQKDLTGEEREITAGMENFIHLGADFKDTAEMIGALDLVISVDSAWAHWAGAIGRPVWVLLSYVAEWRWLAGRDDSPWYPTARLFRQSGAGDWDGVMQRVKTDLGKAFPVA